MNKTMNVKKVSLLTLLAATLTTTLVACNSNTNLKAPETLPGNWLIDSIQDKALLNNSNAQLSFDADERLSGSASCNNISSSYSVKERSLTIGPMATTRKMCRPALMEQERHLLQALGKVKRFQLIDGKLSMYDQQGTLQVKAHRTKP